MSAAVVPYNVAALRKRITTKQAQQAARRSHAAALQTIINWVDLEIVNLQAQLNNAAERNACNPQNGAATAAPAPSAAGKSSKHATTPSCPPTPTNQDAPARCPGGK